MPKLPFKNIEHIVYEHTTEGMLVAIEKENAKKISEYFKANKGAKKLPNDKINGYKFIMDEEYNSLKIDFDTEYNFEIQYLKKFPLK